jgi:hypothetical protein
MDARAASAAIRHDARRIGCTRASVREQGGGVLARVEAARLGKAHGMSETHTRAVTGRDIDEAEEAITRWRLVWGTSRPTERKMLVAEVALALAVARADGFAAGQASEQEWMVDFVETMLKTGWGGGSTSSAHAAGHQYLAAIRARGASPTEEQQVIARLTVAAVERLRSEHAEMIRVAAEALGTALEYRSFGCVSVLAARVEALRVELAEGRAEQVHLRGEIAQLERSLAWQQDARRVAEAGHLASDSTDSLGGL